jgi:hypothetical protein
LGSNPIADQRLRLLGLAPGRGARLPELLLRAA